MSELLKRTVEIKKSNVRVVEVPFNEPVHLPFGRIDTRPSLWIEVDTDVDGISSVGAAEGASLPMQIPLYDDYSGNLGGNAGRIIEGLSGNPLSLDEMVNRIASTELGGNFATARMTVEAALIDSIARADGKSVVSYFDDNESQAVRRIPYGKSITEQESSKILTAAESAMQSGAKRLKFKLSPSNFSELYPALIKIKALYPEIDAMVDANGMFDPQNVEHLAMLSAVDGLELLTIEEPVSRAGNIKGLMAHRVLADVLPLVTPVTIDDAVKSAQDASTALDEGLAQIVNLKPGRVGSFLKCIEIADYAKSRGSEIMVGGMFEATPGRMMTLTLAAYCLKQGFKIPGDVSLPQERLKSDISEPVLFLDENNDVVFKPIEGWGYPL